MADINAVNNSFASAPQSFSQRDRAEELKDARQPVSQFDSRALAQNETVDTDQRANSATTVFAANAASDSNTARSTATAASSIEVSSDTVSLQQTADAFEGQLQRAALERQSRPQEDAQESSPSTVGSSDEAAPQQSQAANERREAPEQTRDVELPSPDTQQSPDRVESEDNETAQRAENAPEQTTNRDAATSEQNAELASSPSERDNAEDALGFS